MQRLKRSTISAEVITTRRMSIFPPRCPSRGNSQRTRKRTLAIMRIVCFSAIWKRFSKLRQ